MGAVWFAGVAGAAAVKDHPVREHYPVFFRDELFEVAFDLFGVSVCGQPEALRKPRDVRIDDDAAGNAERISHNDVRRLSGNAAER